MPKNCRGEPVRATRLEHSIRNGVFGLFWNRLNPCAGSVWQVRLLQYIEQNTRYEKGRRVAPDHYRIVLNPALVDSPEHLTSLADEMGRFIRRYLKEQDIYAHGDVTVAVQTVDRVAGNAFQIAGSFSADRRPFPGLRLAVGRIHDYAGGFRFIDLLNPGRYAAGRAKDAAVHLPHPCVSLYHALLRFDEHGSVAIRDLHSVNGTMLRGERLAPNTWHRLDIPAAVSIAGIVELTLRRRNFL